MEVELLERPTGAVGGSLDDELLAGSSAQGPKISVQAVLSDEEEAAEAD